MSWKIIKYCHPGIYVQNSGAKTYHFRVSDNGTIVESALDNDGHDTARSAAVAYLKGYRRWFGHWIPIGLESAASPPL
jgi:hypothetical protein